MFKVSNPCGTSSFNKRLAFRWKAGLGLNTCWISGRRSLPCEQSGAPDKKTPCTFLLSFLAPLGFSPKRDSGMVTRPFDLHRRRRGRQTASSSFESSEKTKAADEQRAHGFDRAIIGKRSHVRDNTIQKRDDPAGSVAWNPLSTYRSL